MVRFITNTNVVPARRSPLRVIGAGLPRTATSSLQAALEELGFSPCLHMAQIIHSADRQQLLLDALYEKHKQRRQKLVRQLVDGYAAVCDLPAIFFLRGYVPGRKSHTWPQNERRPLGSELLPELGILL